MKNPNVSVFVCCELNIMTIKQKMQILNKKVRPPKRVVKNAIIKNVSSIYVTFVFRYLSKGAVKHS